MVRILLADHRALIRVSLRTLLQARKDFAICGEADNGGDAVKLAIGAKPDVAIRDVNMLGLNGIGAMRQVHTATPNTEILIFTDENNEDSMCGCLRAQDVRAWRFSTDDHVCLHGSYRGEDDIRP